MGKRERKSGVYFLYQGENLVYIGQTRDIIARLQTHIREGEKEFDSFAFVETSEYKNIEGDLLLTHRPKYNKMGGKTFDSVGDGWTSKFKTMKECVETYRQEHPRILVGEIADELDEYKRTVMVALSKHEEEVPAWHIGNGWEVDRDWYEQNKDTIKQWINEMLTKENLLWWMSRGHDCGRNAEHVYCKFPWVTPMENGKPSSRYCERDCFDAENGFWEIGEEGSKRLKTRVSDFPQTAVINTAFIETTEPGAVTGADGTRYGYDRITMAGGQVYYRAYSYWEANHEEEDNV